jgi:hypothetical protein
VHTVVITGVGIVSPLGVSLGELWRRLEAGDSGVRTVARFDPSRFGCRLAAQVELNGSSIVDGPYSTEIRRAGKFVHYAVVAAEQALADDKTYYRWTKYGYGTIGILAAALIGLGYVFWPFGKFLHHPCVVKGYISLPGSCSGFGKQFCKTKRRKKNDKRTDKVNNE